MNKLYKIRVRSEQPIKVDPLVTEAIKKAAEKEGYVDWAQTPETPLPPFTRSRIKLYSAPLWAFCKEITSNFSHP